MFDVGLSQLSDDDLLSELRRRYHSMVFAGLSLDQEDSEYILGGSKLICIGLAASLENHCITSEAE